MPVEIGSLVVNGSFMSKNDDEVTISKMRDEVARMRLQLREEFQDMIAEAERRREDR